MSHRKLSNVEVSQIVHYGARVTSKKDKDGKFTHEAQIIRDALRLGDSSIAYIFFNNLPYYLSAKTPEEFLLRLLEDVGLVERWGIKSSELTVLSGTVGDDRRRGSIKRISDVPIMEE